MSPSCTRHALAAAIGLGLLTNPGYAADPLDYSVEISGIGSGAITATLRASSQLVTLSEAGPVPPFALAMRARDDIPRLQTALDSFGYYQNSVVLTIAGLTPDDPELPATLDDIPEGRAAPVKIAVTLGPLYRLGRIALRGDAVAERHRGALGLAGGEPAWPAGGRAAQPTRRAAWREAG